jgi:hypothetical protein
LPSRWSIMPRRASHTFFSICITSRLCGNFKCFQYGSFHRADLRVNNFGSASFCPCFLFFVPYASGLLGFTSFTFSRYSNVSSILNFPGSSRFSRCPSKAKLLRHL